MNKLFVLVGPSAAGKTYISKFLVGNNLENLNELISNYCKPTKKFILNNVEVLEEERDRIKLNRIITSTTRVPRSNELDGIDYNFYDVSSFKDKLSKGDFLEYVSNFGNYYGTTYESIKNSLLENNSIIVLDDKGAIKMKEILGNQVITIFLDVPISIIEKRMNCRNDNKDSINSRLTNLSIMTFKDKADYVINSNDRIDFVLSDILSIISNNINKDKE